MKINRLLTNICSENLTASKIFYTALFDFNVDFDSGWFVHLISDDKQLELGLIKKNHEIVPKKYQNHPSGMYITFVVENADNLFEIAQSKGFKIEQAPHDTAYGQRRLLLEGPDGELVDISSPIANFKF